jgi:hypothetical protein
MVDLSACAHCGRTDLGSAAARIAWVVTSRTQQRVAVCDPVAPGRPVCVNLVGQYRHDAPCAVCARYVPPGKIFEDASPTRGGPRVALEKVARSAV